MNFSNFHLASIRWNRKRKHTLTHKFICLSWSQQESFELICLNFVASNFLWFDPKTMSAQESLICRKSFQLFTRSFCDCMLAAHRTLLAIWNVLVLYNLVGWVENILKSGIATSQIKISQKFGDLFFFFGWNWGHFTIYSLL